MYHLLLVDEFGAAEATAIAALPETSAAVMGTKDMREGMQSFIERRQAVITGR
jgi:hypothetical protein